MTNSLPPEPEISGWKAIAAHLAVSIRAAQTWETDYGMPVHRMPGKKGRVWIERAEVDAWKQQISTTPPAPPVANEPIPPVVIESSPPPSPPIGRRWLLGGLATAAVCGAAWRFLPRRGGPVRASQIGNALCAFDDRGNQLWDYPFPIGPVDPAVNGIHLPPFRNIQVADMRSDGSKQVIFSATFANSPGDPSSATHDELHCFSSEGKLLWRYKPKLSVKFGDREFSGPWDITDVMVQSDSSTPVVWVTLAHLEWWPGALVAIDAAGKDSLKFVNAGNLYRVVYLGGNKLAVCGVNNEFASGCLAILPTGAAAARSPQTPGTQWECVSGMTEAPERYFRFPPTELNAAYGLPYNRAVGVQLVNDQIVVEVQEVGELNLPSKMAALYRFDRNLDIQDLSLSDSFVVQHRLYEKEGKLDHPLKRCPMLAADWHVLHWEPQSGWTTIPVPIENGFRADARL